MNKNKKSGINREEWAKRKQEWLEKLKRTQKNISPTEDHKRGLRALQNVQRREILRFIGYDVKNFEDIKNEIKLDDSQIQFHLSMLEQALFIEKLNDKWRATPRGIGYLENVEWSQF